MERQCDMPAHAGTVAASLGSAWATAAWNGAVIGAGQQADGSGKK